MTNFTKAFLSWALLCLTCCPILLGQNIVSELEAFPAYEEVVEHFFQGHGAPPADKEYFFEKRPDGYWVGMRDRRDWTKVSESPVLSWSLVKKAYVDGGSDQGRGADEAKQFLQGQAYNARNFDKHPYYGYAGWENDVAGALGEIEELPDKLLNGLARAYSSKAGNMLQDRAGNVPEGDLVDYLIDFDHRVFSKATLNAHGETVKQAIAAFKRLDKQNPAYPLLVGAPRVKLANEYMTAYLDLLIIGQESRAKAFLEPDIYPQIYLSMARNLLSSCPQNAVLFTYGDNDTYPLLYVQQADNFRQDVLLINLSLLNSPSYLNHVLHGLPKGSLPKMTLDMELYRDDKLAGISEVKLGKSLTSDAFLADIAERFEKGKDLEVTEFAGFQVEEQEGVSQPKGALPVSELSLGGQAYGPYRVWYRSHIFLLDFLHANNFERPVCFSIGTSKNNFPGLADNLWQQGLVYQLLPFKADAEHSRFKEAGIRSLPMDIDASTRLFIHNYDYEGLRTWTPLLPVFQIGLRPNLHSSFAKLLLHLKEAREFEPAPELISLYTKHFFKAGERFQAFNLNIAEYAYDAGMEDEASKMADFLFADANRIGTELLSGETLEAGQTQNLRWVIAGLDLLYDQLGNKQRADQVRDLNRRVLTLFE